jgi:hypothetical protein
MSTEDLLPQIPFQDYVSTTRYLEARRDLVPSDKVWRWFLNRHGPELRKADAMVIHGSEVMVKPVELDRFILGLKKSLKELFDVYDRDSRNDREYKLPREVKCRVADGVQSPESLGCKFVTEYTGEFQLIDDVACKLSMSFDAAGDYQSEVTLTFLDPLPEMVREFWENLRAAEKCFIEQCAVRLNQEDARYRVVYQ